MSTDLVAGLKAQTIEIPSWGFSAAGTRFARHSVPGQARSLDERVADSALVARYTGANLRNPAYKEALKNVQGTYGDVLTSDELFEMFDVASTVGKGESRERVSV